MKAYTVNNHLVGVGNDQILGTDQGGGGGVEYEAGQYISIDENNVISVTGISAGNGTLSIVQNVTGAPLEITYPTDVAPDAVFYQIDSVTGNAYSNSTSNAVINYYYGETPADFNGSDDSILFTINDDISNIGAINFYYTTDATGYGGPSLTTTSINGGSTGIVQSGTYKLKAQYNQAGTSSPYGKYLQIMFNWRSYASDYAQSLQWAQEALSKITFFGVARPDPSLGVNVNLDRYYLGNNVNTSTLSSDLACQVTVDSTTKQQTVYLPGYMPSSWTSRVAQYVAYGSNRFSPGGYRTSQQYIAYKEITNNHYLYAFCTDNDVINSKMTFICYNESGQAIEKWTVDYSNYSSNVWTTTPITPDMSEYIPYAASGVYLPNSKFEIDTEGQAYKVTATSTETAYGSWNGDGGFAYGNAYILPTRNADGTGTLKAGIYRFTLPDTFNSIKVGVVGNTAAAYNEMVIPATNHVADLVITEDLTFIPQAQGYDWIYIYAWTNSDGTGSTSPGVWGNTSSVVYISPEVKEEYLTDGDLELNGDNQVTAIDGHALVVPAAQVNSDWNANSGVAEILNKPTEIQLIAGTNVQVEVTGASAIISAQGGGGAGYATETYVQNYVQNYSIPVQVVATSAAATGTNILYVVTGS